MNSDFGLVVERLSHEYPPTTHHRTTICFAQEPKVQSHLGSCDLPLYEPIRNRVEVVVRTVVQLASVAETLVESRV